MGISTRIPPWLDQLGQDYKKKISYWIDTNIQYFNSPSHDRDAAQKKIESESEILLDALSQDDFVILCDERGSSLSSEEFAKKLEKILAGGKKRIVLIIGGAYGVNDSVKKRADLKLCLSEFTMTHHLAMAVALEQTYRAMTILKGTSYHNG
ncbi:MAG: 23S rRNA (pseudouridine(1915)-N(3))-methyltransferase RlmH [Oligoflexia bacterium]|nr:23S rRNA (pseudouridine(1915)-N(3))-methyltransferase RlmH [Oligoflexia bacterium]